MRVGRVPELGDERVPVEHRLDASTLDATAATMDQAHFRQTSRVRRHQVLVDDGRNVARRECVEIDGVFDGKRVEGIHGRSYRFTYSAVTLVVMPPLAEKAPTMRMRRGAQAATRSSRI